MRHLDCGISERRPPLWRLADLGGGRQGGGPAGVQAPARLGSLDIVKPGTTTPGAKSVTRKIERWLNTMDPDEGPCDGLDRGSLPLRFDDWEVDVYAHPVALEYRDDPHHPFIGSRFSGISNIDDITPLRRQISGRRPTTATSTSRSSPSAIAEGRSAKDFAVRCGA